MLSFRKPTTDDMEMYFFWANDPDVRIQSFNSSQIQFDAHKEWFVAAINNEAFSMFVFQNSEGKDVGQVRIEKQNDSEAFIGVSLDLNHRGKGYAKEMLKLASDSFLEANSSFILNAFIKEGNLSSKISFEKAGFQFVDMVEYENFKSSHLIKKKL